MPTEIAQRMVFPAIGQVEWEEVPVPAPGALGPTEVIVRSACTLVSAGTELAIFTGTHIGYTVPNATYPRMPFRPGYACAGIIEATGRDVTAFAVGDRVSGALPHAERSVADVTHADLLKIPDGVSNEAACLARLSVFPMQGVRLAKVQLGEHIAVFGQGLIGQFARQLAVLDGGLISIAIDLIDARLEVSRRHGATYVLNPARDDVQQAILTATDRHGVDVAIEASGNPAVINAAMYATATLGRVILTGSPRGRVEIDPYSDIHRKGISVIGAHQNTAGDTANHYHRWTTAEHQRIALELARQGRLRTDGLISHRLPALDALGIFAALSERPQDYLGVILHWSEE